VGSAARAGINPVVKNKPETAIVRAKVLGQCNIVQTYAYVDDPSGGQNAALSVFS
jgi:hypothetical protein